jgi:hypothetical protein
MVPEKIHSEDLKRSLVNRYQETLINRLNRQDLEELQSYLRDEYDPKTGWNPGARLQFEAKLRRYFHEEVIRREISGIEALLNLLTPADLKN